MKTKVCCLNLYLFIYFCSGDRSGIHIQDWIYSYFQSTYFYVYTFLHTVLHTYGLSLHWITYADTNHFLWFLFSFLFKPQAGVQLFEAEHDFHPEAPEEVGFRRGDKIILLEKTDENWWTGQVQSSGEQGLFPRNYVREVKN